MPGWAPGGRWAHVSHSVFFFFVPLAFQAGLSFSPFLLAASSPSRAVGTAHNRTRGQQVQLVPLMAAAAVAAESHFLPGYLFNG